MKAKDLVSIIEEHSPKYLAVRYKDKLLWVVNVYFDFHDGNVVILKVDEEKKERMYIVQTIRLFLQRFSDCEVFYEYNYRISKIGEYSAENDTIILSEETIKD